MFRAILTSRLLLANGRAIIGVTLQVRRVLEARFGTTGVLSSWLQSVGRKLKGR